MYSSAFDRSYIWGLHDHAGKLWPLTSASPNFIFSIQNSDLVIKKNIFQIQRIWYSEIQLCVQQSKICTVVHKDPKSYQIFGAFQSKPKWIWSNWLINEFGEAEVKGQKYHTDPECTLFLRSYYILCIWLLTCILVA